MLNRILNTIKELYDKYFCCSKFSQLEEDQLRIYIVVPYSKKDEAITLGARWDNENKKWYAPDSTYHLLLSKFGCYKSLVFKGENRSFGGNLLYIDMIPINCSHKNVRTNTSQEKWEAIKYTVRDRSNFICELCGVKTSTPHCHERFSYNINTKVQKLERFLCVCEDCHNTIHWGKSLMMRDGNKVREHLKKVRKMTDDEADKHIRDAYKLRWGRDNVEWNLDLGIIL